MMLFLFVFMTMALGFNWLGYRKLSLVFLVFCLSFAIKEFLWEIHSSDYGYSMPWLQL
ncbi:hypothetical protein ACI0FR_00591 [Paenochrobactrum sp. BZR 201-1]